MILSGAADMFHKTTLSRRTLLAGAAVAKLAGTAELAAPRVTSGRFGSTRWLGNGLARGRFAWRAGDHRMLILADPLGAVVVPGSGDPAGLAGAWIRDDSGPARPEWFGAKGDGTTNDSRALAALAVFINHQGGGEVAFRPVVYAVGMQERSRRRGSVYAFKPFPLLEFKDCTEPVIVHGNNARLRCVPGLRYGTFDPVTGKRTDHPLPFTGKDEAASPYSFMIKFERCKALVSVRDIELDGNLRSLIIGGPFGDMGRQITCIGVGIFDCRGDELLENVYAHHHALDGIKVHGVNPPVNRVTVNPSRIIRRVRSEYNARQGCSIDSGWRYLFEDCRFNYSGTAGLASNPRGGVDIEAHARKRVRDVRFVRCEFIGNAGAGLVADKGNNADISFDRCRFIGTINWSAWPRMPRMKFFDCTFVGAMVNAYGSADASLATRFERCTFRDDPTLAPAGIIYLGKNPSKPIADLGRSQNVMFDTCRFILSHAAALPWSTRAIYRDCTMTQTSARRAYPRGTFEGNTTITGNVDLKGSIVVGRLTVNGKRIQSGRL